MGRASRPPENVDNLEILEAVLDYAWIYIRKRCCCCETPTGKARPPEEPDTDLPTPIPSTILPISKSESREKWYTSYIVRLHALIPSCCRKRVEPPPREIADIHFEEVSGMRMPINTLHNLDFAFHVLTTAKKKPCYTPENYTTSFSYFEHVNQNRRDVLRVIYDLGELLLLCKVEGDREGWRRHVCQTQLDVIEWKERCRASDVYFERTGKVLGEETAVQRSVKRVVRRWRYRLGWAKEDTINTITPLFIPVRKALRKARKEAGVKYTWVKVKSPKVIASVKQKLPNMPEIDLPGPSKFKAAVGKQQWLKRFKN